MMTSPFSFFRRLLGVSLAITLAASGAEALSGELRDGNVHHEDLAKATAHHDVQLAIGDHGHEDASSPGGHGHGSGHEHGTSADHCTHVHGLGLVMPVGFAFLASTAEWGFIDPVFHTVFATETLKHPPKV